MCRVGTEDLVRSRAPRGMEPFAAPERVPPSFEVNAIGVAAKEQVVLEILVARAGTVTGNMSLSTTGQFGFVRLRTAIRASQLKHRVPPRSPE